MALKFDGFILDYESAEYEIDYCYCDKVGQPLYAGRCSDAELTDEKEWIKFLKQNDFDLNLVENLDDVSQPENNVNKIKETKKQKKRRRAKKHFNRQKRIYDALKNWYPSPVWPRYENDLYWKNDENPGEILYFHRSHHQRHKQWLKRQSSKVIRNAKGIPKRGNGWKKVFDLWWELW